MNEICSFVIDMLRGLVHARHGGVRCSANRTRASCDNVIYARTAHIRCRVETADSVSPIVASPASALFIGHLARVQLPGGDTTTDALPGCGRAAVLKQSTAACTGD